MAHQTARMRDRAGRVNPIVASATETQPGGHPGRHAHRRRCREVRGPRPPASSVAVGSCISRCVRCSPRVDSQAMDSGNCSPGKGQIQGFADSRATKSPEDRRFGLSGVPDARFRRLAGNARSGGRVGCRVSSTCRQQPIGAAWTSSTTKEASRRRRAFGSATSCVSRWCRCSATATRSGRPTCRHRGQCRGRSRGRRCPGHPARRGSLARGNGARRS